MFTTLFASDRSLRRRTMTTGALILSSVFHATLLAGAVYATVRPSEESGEPVELVAFYARLESPKPPPPGEVGSFPRVGASVTSPPRLLADPEGNGEVVAEFVVLPNGTIDLTTVRIVSSTHDGLEAATRSMLGRLRFVPGRVDGEPAPVLTRLPITWQVGGG